MPSRLSLGINFHPKFPPETLVDYARQAESSGFDELWLWEDSFYAGAFTSAATILAATHTIKVGIGLLPVTVRNPLFTAMEITTLARLYPGRFLPGFGHGVESWMKQIGAYPKSTLQALAETVTAVRGLLSGEKVTMQGSHVHLSEVSMNLLPAQVPPFFIGGIRQKTLRLAGRIGDGTLLTGMSSPAYLRWAGEHIRAGMAESGRTENHLTVSALCKVDPDGATARKLARQFLAVRFADGDPHLFASGLDEEAREMVRQRGVEETARIMPEAWVDEFAAAGTPDQAAGMLKRLQEAGASSVVLEPIDGDPSALQEYIRYLLPLFRN